MPLSDRELLQRCLAHDQQAWVEFVDRFAGMIYQVVRHAAHLRSVVLDSAEVDDLASDVFAALVENDFAVLRRFRGLATLPTYLTVIARRVVVRKLVRRQALQRIQAAKGAGGTVASEPDDSTAVHDEVRQMLACLTGKDAQLVRSFYLEHKTYAQISKETGLPENSIGPLLSRIRERLRRSARPIN